MTCSAVPPKLVTYIFKYDFTFLTSFKNPLLWWNLYFLNSLFVTLFAIFNADIRQGLLMNAIKIAFLFCQATIKVIKNNFYSLCSQLLQSSLLDIVLFSVSLILFLTSMFYILSYFFRFFKRFWKILYYVKLIIHTMCIHWSIFIYCLKCISVLFGIFNYFW